MPGPSPSGGGACERGIYDNMKTAVDAVFVGKDRKFNRRFAQMCSHYLVEPTACTPAAGWEKGQVENQVGSLRQRLFIPRPHVKTLEELNRQLEDGCVAYARESRHPDDRERTVWEALEAERPALVAIRGPFDGFREVDVGASKTCLVRFDRNRYSIEAQMRPPLMDSGTSGLLCHAGAPLDQGARTVDGGLDCWRRASSADREKPLASAPVASGDRGEEAQQRKEPLAAAPVKALDQRDRQAIVIDGRQECGPADLPERARREDLAPPRSPALDRPAVDADQLGQLSHPRGGRALPQDRDQHNCRGEIDLAPEEPQRRRRCACAATVAGAAEAEAPIMLLAEPGRTATGLAAILGGMQNAAAQRASSSPRRNRDVLVKDEKQLMECGVGQQG